MAEPAKTNGAEAGGTEQQKQARIRSPNYPAIDLETAIRKLRAFHQNARRNPITASVAAGLLGYKPTSSGAQTTIAALKAFGLIFDSGEGQARQIQISDLGLRIILDKRPVSGERDEALRQAALNPKIHQDLWAQCDGDLLPDGELRHRLIFAKSFNENVVDSLLREFRATLAFAKLTKSDSLSLEAEDKNGSSVDDEDMAMHETQIQQQTQQDPPPPGKLPSGRTPVGSDIPVASGCIMGVNAMGRVTQGGIDKLIAYLQLIKGSFPTNGEA